MASRRFNSGGKFTRNTGGKGTCRAWCHGADGCRADSVTEERLDQSESHGARLDLDAKTKSRMHAREYPRPETTAK